MTKLSPNGSALEYSTYLGGTGCDEGYGIAVGATGEAYVTGRTSSLDFPVFNAMQPVLAPGGVCGGEVPRPCFDAFVAHFSSEGSTLLYATYLGGSNDDEGNGIAVDGTGNAYITGRTTSPDFPVTPGVLQTTYGPAADAFIVKLDLTRGALVFSTFLGGNQGVNGSEEGRAIAVDSAGDAYVAGTTGSTNFPTVNPFQPTFAGQSRDGFVSKLSPGGASLLYSTYLGGSNTQEARGTAVDSQGGAYVVGYTTSTDFPTVSPIQSQCAGGSNDVNCEDIFIFHLNSENFVYLSTYLGGSGDDGASSVALDSQDGVYLAGFSSSPSIGTALATGGQSLSVGTTEASEMATKPKSARQFTPPLVHSRAEYLAQTDGRRGLVAKLTFVGPLASLSRAGVDFGGELLGTTSAVQAVTLQNTGDQSLFISGISVGGADSSDFAQTNDCGVSLAATASCTISVTFTPTAIGSRSATLTVSDSAAGSPHTVVLSGTGTDFALGAAAGGSTSATVNAGQTATYKLQIAPTGFTGSVALGCAWSGTQPRGTNCSVSPTSVNLDGTNAAPFTVTVTTTARAMAPSFGGQRPPLQGPLSRHLGLPIVMWLVALLAAAIIDGRWLLVGERFALPREPAGLPYPPGTDRRYSRPVPWEGSRRRLAAASLVAASLLLALLWTACGGGAPAPAPQTGTPAGTYALTITATSGTASKTTTLTLKVN